MKKHLPIIVLVLVGLIVGLYALPGYGESVDELSQHSYAERTIQAVKSLVKTGTLPVYFFEEEPKQGSHGPAFIMAVVLLRIFSCQEGPRLRGFTLAIFFIF